MLLTCVGSSKRNDVAPSRVAGDTGCRISGEHRGLLGSDVGTVGKVMFRVSSSG